MDTEALRLKGLGNIGQALQFIALAGAAYSMWAQIDTKRTTEAATAAVTHEQIVRAQEADKEVNTKVSRLEDALHDMRLEYRRDIDTACACCRRQP